MASLFLKVKPEDRRAFEKTFEVLFADYFDSLFGFDIIKFDDNVIKTPYGLSMNEHIKTKYGQDTIDLITRLNNIF